MPGCGSFRSRPPRGIFLTGTDTENCGIDRGDLYSYHAVQAARAGVNMGGERGIDWKRKGFQVALLGDALAIDEERADTA